MYYLGIAGRYLDGSAVVDNGHFALLDDHRYSVRYAVLQACGIFVFACRKKGGNEFQLSSRSERSLGDPDGLANGDNVSRYRRFELPDDPGHPLGYSLLQNYEACYLPVRSEYQKKCQVKGSCYGYVRKIKMDMRE